MQVVAEWIELVSITWCVGVVACRIWVLGPLQDRGLLPARILPSMWRIFGIGLAALTAGSIAELLLRSMEISGQPLSAVFRVLPVVLFRTHYGSVWLVRIATLTALSLSMLSRRLREAGPFLWFALAAVFVIAATKSASGHAADEGDFSVAETIDWLHLLAASVWGGGLMVLFAAILPGLSDAGKEAAAALADTAGRFSAMVGIAVGVIALTALYNLWIDVRSIGGLLNTTYGLAVAAKILLFLVVINFGAFNRYVSVPRLQEWGGRLPKNQGIFGRMAGAVFAPLSRNLVGRRMAARFRVLVGIEAFVIVGVLFCASVLRHEIPARHYMHMQQMHDQGAMSLEAGGGHKYHE